MKFQGYASMFCGKLCGYVEKVPHSAVKIENPKEALHVVSAPCIGSCGSACPNHECNAHNGQKFCRSSFDSLRKMQGYRV